MACVQDQSNLIQLKVIDTVRKLSGAANNFVGESNILNALKGFNQAGLGKDTLKLVLGNLVQCNRMECFIPLNQMGSCGGGCASDCCGCCGRYYRVKIG